MPELTDYMNPSLAPEQRCELLLGCMTLEEKVGQLCQYVGEAAASDTGNADEKVGYVLALGDKVELVRAGRVGSFLKVPGAAEANTLQELAAASRLKIPLLIGTDAIHGHGMDLAAATIFPSPIGIASSFDPDLAERIAACTAREMRATGFHWSFSPNVDITRDPRWGRTGRRLEKTHASSVSSGRPWCEATKARILRAPIRCSRAPNTWWAGVCRRTA